MAETSLSRLTLHTAWRLLVSLRGLLALLFSLLMVLAVGLLYEQFTGQGTAIGELVLLFAGNPEFQVQSILFDSTLTKLVTMFLGPMFAFDAISGDRGKDMLGVYLSRPIRRSNYLLSKILGASLAFATVFFVTIAAGFPIFQSKVPSLTPGAYFATAVLMYLLGVFSMCVALLVSTLSRNNLLSFIVSFGVLGVLMVPNASKYSSDALMNAAKLTPHYYATYFTTHGLDAAMYAGCALVILAFCLVFVALAVLKFRSEDL